MQHIFRLTCISCQQVYFLLYGLFHDYSVASCLFLHGLNHFICQCFISLKVISCVWCSVTSSPAQIRKRWTVGTWNNLFYSHSALLWRRWPEVRVGVLPVVSAGGRSVLAAPLLSVHVGGLTADRPELRELLHGGTVKFHRNRSTFPAVRRLAVAVNGARLPGRLTFPV